MKKGLKGLFTASLAVVALGGLVACGGNEEPTPTPTPSQSETTKPTTPEVVGRDFKFAGKAKLKTVQFNEDGTPKMENVMVPKVDESGNVVMGENNQPVKVELIGKDGKPVMQPVQKDEEYDIKLEGKKGSTKFTLEAKSTVSTVSKTLKGKYDFKNGIGFEFTIEGSNEVIRSSFNPETKLHTINYTLGLGDYGKGGDIKLTFKDETFTISEESLFVSSANFGYAWTTKTPIQTPDGAQTGIGFGMQFFPEDATHGTVQFKNNHLPALNQWGTYTFENDKFTVKIKDYDGTEIVAESTNTNGIYVIPFTIHFADENLEVKMTWNSNYYGGYGLSTVTYPMGAEFKTTLTLNNDGTFFLDGEPLNPLKSALAGMDLYNDFDVRGNWTYNEETKQYSIIVAGPTEQVFTSTFDEATGLYSMKFAVGVANGTLTGTNFGKNFTPKAA